MAQRNLYIDTDDNQIVTSDSDQTPAPFPALVLGDVISLKVYLLARTKSFPLGQPIYSIINNSDLTLRVGMGPKDGLANHTLATQLFTWLKDATNSYFYGDLPLNTQGLADKINTGESADIWLEAEITNSSGYDWTILQKKIAVQGEVITSQMIQASPGTVALDAATANALFLKRKISGVLYFEDINNAGQYIGVYNENGSLKADPVTGTLP